jgi:hypothetical protein
MTTTPATVDTSPLTGDLTISWIGFDDRRVELEVVLIEKPDVFLVVHVMPTHYRTGR